MLGRESGGAELGPKRRALWIERLGLNRRDATGYGDWFGERSASGATLWGLFLTPCVGQLCGAVAAGHESSLPGASGTPRDHSAGCNIGEGVGKRGRARAAAYEVALGEVKELIVALDCVEIDELASIVEVIAAQELADRVAAMLTNLIRSAETEQS